MKKLIVAISLVLSGITMTTAQTKATFEGSVIYDMSFDGANLPPEATAMLKGSTITTYIKGDKRRMDTSTPVSSQSSIIDEKNKTIINLMDIMGQNYLIKMNEADVKKESESTPVPTIKYIEETKTIAGYKCKKAEITVKDKDGKEETTTIFYTEDLPSSDFRPTYKGLKGFPMEFTIDQGGMKITLVATKVSKETVADTKFDPPKDGYKETTLEELQKEMLKMGGQ